MINNFVLLQPIGVGKMDIEIAAGDILLYSGTSLIDNIIASATHGPFTHAAIAVSPTQLIEAINYGVKLNKIYAPNAVIQIGKSLESVRRDYALNWLYRQLGKKYNILAIVADTVLALSPPALSHTPYLVSPSRLDCSQLVAQFLIVAGVMPIPDSWYVDTSRISPNDVYRAFASITRD